VQPVTLEGRFVRLEPLDAKHAEALAEAASQDLFTYHFPPEELTIQPRNRSLEIGFTRIGKPWQATSVNPESKLLLLEHAFETLGCMRVQLKTDLRNLQSQAAIAKLGAVREGVLRKQLLLPDGHQRDTVMFSITDDEWPAVRKDLEARLAAC
jgi:RimJ/RimL family protein N-acetyltransferase